MTPSQKNIDSFIGDLDEVTQEEISTLRFRGFMRSRNSESLHLAIATGVVAIPLKNIVDIEKMGDGNSPMSDKVVSVKVRNAGDVSYVIPMAPAGVALSSPASDLRTSLFSRNIFQNHDLPPVFGPGVNTSHCTSTHTDGNACDDCQCIDTADDLGQ